MQVNLPGAGGRGVGLWEGQGWGSRPQVLSTWMKGHHGDLEAVQGCGLNG